MIKIPYISLFCVILCFSAFAQEEIKVEYFTEEDGLVHRWIYDILQDENGFIWLATESGLCRYDGYEFKSLKIYENEKERIEIIEKAADGKIWISSKFESVKILEPSSLEIRTAAKGVDFFLPKPTPTLNIALPFFPYLKEADIINFSSTARLADSTHKDVEEKNLLESLFDEYKTYGIKPIITKKENRGIWIWHNHSHEGDYTTISQDYTYYDLTNSSWQTFKISEWTTGTIANSNLPIDTEGRFWFPSFDTATTELFDSFLLPKDVPLEDWISIRMDNHQNIWIYNQQFELFRFDRKKGSWSNLERLKTVVLKFMKTVKEQFG